MKTSITLVLLLLLNLLAFSQVANMSLQELNQKRTEAVASRSTSKVTFYDEAIKLKTELNTAIKNEDFEKAATIKDKLNNLKFTESQTNSKTIELQEAIKKAIANEDYEKAAALKKELEASKNGTNPTSTTTTKTNTPTINKVENKIENKVENKVENKTENTTVQNTQTVSALTQKDIYGITSVYMGLDFSLFNLISIKKANEEDLNLKFIPIWQKLFSKEIPDEKLAKWLSKVSFTSDCNYSENAYTKNLNRKWIVSSSPNLSDAQIESHLQSYTSSNHGLALVFLPTAFDEITANMILNVVWFDLDTRTIVHKQEITVKAMPSTMTSRWFNALVAGTKKYVDEYFKKYQRANMVIEKKEPVERLQKQPKGGGMIGN